MLLAERWILAALRHRTFFALEELRQAVKPLVDKLNQRLMRKLKKSRWQVFEKVERAALRPLPTRRYEFAVRARPRVYIDYHVEFDGHFYSVPYDDGNPRVSTQPLGQWRRRTVRQQINDTVLLHVDKNGAIGAPFT